MTDRLTLTRAFEGAGIQSELAERLTVEIYDAIHESVATKADLKADLAELEQNINATKARDLHHIRTSVTEELAALDKKITVVGYRLITSLSISMVVVGALLFAALHHAARLAVSTSRTLAIALVILALAGCVQAAPEAARPPYDNNRDYPRDRGGGGML